MNSAPDMASGAFQMLTALGIILGGLLVVFYLMKRYLKRDGGGGGQLIRVLANRYIGVKKNIALIEVPGSVLVVGVSNDRISLLTKIEDKTVIEGIHRENHGVALSFSDHLQRLTSRLKSDRAGEQPN